MLYSICWLSNDYVSPFLALLDAVMAIYAIVHMQINHSSLTYIFNNN